MFKIGDGRLFVGLARRSVEYFLHTGRLPADEAPKPEYMEKRGVFVTLHTFPGNELRGCIGYTEPQLPLWQAIKECAVGAGFRDPRFPQLGAGELDAVVVEVSVLTPPEEVGGSPGEWPAKIKCGRDGLIIEKGSQKGLLLPQVAQEYGWSEREFLQHTCMKAGLAGEEWTKHGCRLWKFQAQVFRELKPKGEVAEGGTAQNVNLEDAGNGG